MINEWPFVDGSRRADFCFFDRQAKLALASFELKILATSQAGGWPNLLRRDVCKHLDPTKKIKDACDAFQRYSVVILATEEDNLKEKSEALVSEKIRDPIPNPVFSTSASIKLNRLEATDTKAQDKADLWKYLRVIVFTGAHVG